MMKSFVITRNDVTTVFFPMIHARYSLSERSRVVTRKAGKKQKKSLAEKTLRWILTNRRRISFDDWNMVDDLV